MIEQALKSQIVHLAGEMSAIRAVIAALVRTHPAPERLREAIAASTAMESTVLATIEEKVPGLKSEIAGVADKLTAVFLEQLPPAKGPV